MARFAQKHTNTFDPHASDSYEHGYSFGTEKYSYITKPGLNENVIKEISHIKNEPAWMLEQRLTAYKQFQAKPLPMWGADLTAIDYDKIRYYLRPTDDVAGAWEDVPPEVKQTFDRLGIPEAEKKVLAGVKAQYDCLTADARVFTPGGIKPIVELKTGEFVYSLNEITNLLEPQRVNGLAAKGVRKIYNVKTQGGREIKVTQNHPFFHLKYEKMDGRTRGRYRKEWRYLSDLKVGDLIAAPVDFPENGEVYHLPEIAKPKTKIKSKNQFGEHELDISNWYAKIAFPTQTSEALMWLFGFYIGDGCFGGKNREQKFTRVELAIPEAEIQLRKEVTDLVDRLFSYKLITTPKDRVLLNSLLFVEFFKQLGFEGTAFTKRIPDWVYKLPKAQKLAFIGGYFDADGTIGRNSAHKSIVLTSVSKELLNEFKMLALSCGLNVSHIWPFFSNYSYKDVTKKNQGFRLNISGNTFEIGSRMLRKKSLLGQRKFIHRFRNAKGTTFRNHTSDHIGFVKILSIEYAGEEQVYDIEVQGYHNFVANGLIVHNSEVVYGSLKDVWAKDGVIFLSMDEGLRQHPDLIKEYFGKVIPSGDNTFSALNSSVWSGGSFVYVPKGVHVKMPLQTYFRINAENAGQFERTLIIVDEGASVHYVEGCFTAGTLIQSKDGLVRIEDIQKGDQVLTHNGRFKEVYHTQIRPYSGDLYIVTLRGNPSQPIRTTEEHPFLIVRRKYKNERNKAWKPEWVPIKDVQVNDYACIPINKNIAEQNVVPYSILIGVGRHDFYPEGMDIPSTSEFFRLVGYYLAEGSISSGHYLNFSFNENERDYITDVKYLLKKLFHEDRVHEAHHKKNHGISVVVRSTRLARLFSQFGTSCDTKHIPTWMMEEKIEKQSQLILGWFRGDGNYYKRQHTHGFKEVFRICTTSPELAWQGQQLLARIGIASGVNVRNRAHEQRLSMYTLVIGGEYMIEFGKLVGVTVEPTLHNKKRATFYFVDKDYLYVPIRSIQKKTVSEIPVYNFSVRNDESYVAGGVAVHNCTAPNFSSGSLHSAVVEIFVKKGARCQYTTIQNWYKNVYNLVTKRAYVEEEGTMVWTDFNMGSKVTMKYPSFVLAGKGAKGETLSMALAGEGQHQDTGSKAIHLAPHTSSTIISKSISKDGGRTSYRGMVNVGPHAYNSQNTVICDALLLDDHSRSDTYPVDRIFNSQVAVQHEATVSKIGDDQLFYLMSRGVTEENARKLIVNGFIDDLVRKLPLEYAVEMNRLIDYEMEGSIG